MQSDQSATRKPRTRRKLYVEAPHPNPVKITTTRHMEALGLTEDGRLIVWGSETQKNVQPIDRFEIDARDLIDCGHYIIFWKGCAITVHLGNCVGGLISVQFMCQNPNTKIHLPRAEAEAMLLGKILKDPEHEKEMARLFAELNRTLAERENAPHKQRGRIPGSKGGAQ